MVSTRIVTLREAHQGDRQWVYRLLTDDSSWRQCGLPRRMDWDSFSAWFTALTHNHEVLKWVGLSTEPIGLAWAEQDGDDGRLTAAVLPELRGLGLGTQMIGLAADYASRDWNRPITAYVEPGHPAAAAAFRHAGFVCQPSSSRADGPVLYRYEGKP